MRHFCKATKLRYQFPLELECKLENYCANNSRYDGFG